jgi:hypothetical protein
MTRLRSSKFAKCVKKRNSVEIEILQAHKASKGINNFFYSYMQKIIFSERKSLDDFSCPKRVGILKRSKSV